MYVLVQDYDCGEGARRAEIDKCLLANALHPSVARVIDLCERGFANPATDLLVERRAVPHRASFAEFLSVANTLPVDSLVCLLNVDCHVSGPWAAAELLVPRRRAADGELSPAGKPPAGTALCLGRYEDAENGDCKRDGAWLHPSFAALHHAHAQDAWVFRTPLHLPACDFVMGTPGADNAIAERMHRAGLVVSNPMHALRIVHVDALSARNPYAWKSDDGARPELRGYMFVPAEDRDGGYVGAISSLMRRQSPGVQRTIATQLYNTLMVLNNNRAPGGARLAAAAPPRGRGLPIGVIADSS